MSDPICYTGSGAREGSTSSAVNSQIRSCDSHNDVQFLWFSFYLSRTVYCSCNERHKIYFLCIQHVWISWMTNRPINSGRLCIHYHFFNFTSSLNSFDCLRVGDLMDCPNFCHLKLLYPYESLHKVWVMIPTTIATWLFFTPIIRILLETWPNILQFLHCSGFGTKALAWYLIYPSFTLMEVFTIILIKKCASH